MIYVPCKWCSPFKVLLRAIGFFIYLIKIISRLLAICRTVRLCQSLSPQHPQGHLWFMKNLDTLVICATWLRLCLASINSESIVCDVFLLFSDFCTSSKKFLETTACCSLLSWASLVPFFELGSVSMSHIGSLAADNSSFWSASLSIMMIGVLSSSFATEIFVMLLRRSPGMVLHGSLTNDNALNFVRVAPICVVLKEASCYLRTGVWRHYSGLCEVMVVVANWRHI